MNCKICNFSLVQGQETCPVCGTIVEKEVVVEPVLPVVEEIQTTPIEPSLSVEPIQEELNVEENIVKTTPIVEEPILPVIDNPVNGGVLVEESIMPEEENVQPLEPTSSDIPVMSTESVIGGSVLPIEDSIQSREQDQVDINIMSIEEPVLPLEPDPLTTPEEPALEVVSQDVINNLEQSVMPVEPVPRPEPTMVMPVEPVMENKIEPNANMTNEALMPENVKKTSPIIGIIVGVIVAILAALTGFFVFNNFFGKNKTVTFNSYDYKITGKYSVKKFDNTRLLILDNDDENKSTWRIEIKPYIDFNDFNQVKENTEEIKTLLTQSGLVIENSELKTISGTEILLNLVNVEQKKQYIVIMSNKGGQLIEATISQKDGSVSEKHLNTLIGVINTGKKK